MPIRLNLIQKIEFTWKHNNITWWSSQCFLFGFYPDISYWGNLEFQIKTPKKSFDILNDESFRCTFTSWSDCLFKTFLLGLMEAPILPPTLLWLELLHVKEYRPVRVTAGWTWLVTPVLAAGVEGLEGLSTAGQRALMTLMEVGETSPDWRITKRLRNIQSSHRC